MRSLAEAKLPIGILAALLAISVGLKAARGPEVRGASAAHRGLVEEQLARKLEAQGFSTRREHADWQSTVIVAARGACKLSARDASRSAGDMTVYAKDAARIGRLRYLLAGQRYESPPTLEITLRKVETKLRHGLRVGGSVPIAVALATSPECGTDDFGLGDIRVPI